MTLASGTRDPMLRTIVLLSVQASRLLVLGTLSLVASAGSPAWCAERRMICVKFTEILRFYCAIGTGTAVKKLKHIVLFVHSNQRLYQLNVLRSS